MYYESIIDETIPFVQEIGGRFGQPWEPTVCSGRLPGLIYPEAV